MVTLMLAVALAQNLPLVENTSKAVTDSGVIEFDSRLPAELQVDGQTVAQLYSPGTLTIRTEAGPHTIIVLTNGRARSLEIDVSRSATAVVLVGRNGLTATARLEPLPEEEGITPVEIRVVGHEEVLLQLDDKRYRIPAGTIKALSIPIGRHTMALKNAAGTVLWARGHLDLTRTGPVVIQITEGRMPEVSGAGSSFSAGS